MYTDIIYQMVLVFNTDSMGKGEGYSCMGQIISFGVFGRDCRALHGADCTGFLGVCCRKAIIFSGREPCGLVRSSLPVFAS